MAEESHFPEAAKDPKRRRVGKKKGSKSNKKAKMMSQSAEGNRGMKPKKIDKKMKKLFRKRAREYNSEDESEHEKEGALGNNNEEEELGGGSSSGEEAGAEGGRGHSMPNVDNEFSEDEEGGVIQPGITRFTEGCNAFRSAFRSIIKKSVHDDVLGPVLSAHKNLVAEKLAEEEAERKVKGEAKREKQLVIEKGHVKPANYLDAHEKFLIGVSTKGVVKLFNAVNKAQNAQKGLNPSKFKDAKVIQKRRKEAFFSELRNRSSSSASAKAHTSNDGEGPAWAPLRDNYMLTNPKLKDWDKMPDTVVADDVGRASEDSGSDDD